MATKRKTTKKKTVSTVRADQRAKPRATSQPIRRGAKTASRNAVRQAGPGAARARSAGALFEKLVVLQARLRAPGGCPWDREQTHETLRTFLIEESYEVLDALERGAPEDFQSELGDLLLQIIFHALLAQEKRQFDIRDVIETVHDKMVRRHPHVFGAVRAGTSAEVLKNWEQIKGEERREKSQGLARNKKGSAGKSVEEPEREDASILAGLPRTLPAMLEAWQLTRRAARIGFDWDDLEGIFAKLEEEMQEVRDALRDAATEQARRANGNLGEPPPSAANAAVKEELGDLLFVAVNVARFLKIDPEIALKRANRKFAQRFRWMEHQMASAGGKLADAPRDRMEELWEQSKKRT
jgi:MazG family protein